jgi:hypothetical protein
LEAGDFTQTDILLLQETKVTDERIPIAQLVLRQMGWISHFSGAICIPSGGVSGGVAVLWRPHVHAIETVSIQYGQHSGRLAGVVFHLPAIGICPILSIYGHVGDHEITKEIILGNFPLLGDQFLAMDDYNMDVSATAACISNFRVGMYLVFVWPPSLTMPFVPLPFGSTFGNATPWKLGWPPTDPLKHGSNLVSLKPRCTLLPGLRGALSFPLSGLTSLLIRIGNFGKAPSGPFTDP